MAGLEQIISNLLVPDNAVIQQATEDLRKAYKDPEFVPTLCNLISTSQEPNVRQYAAVLLRRRLGRNKNWLKLPPADRKIIKDGILSTLTKEPERFVRNAIAQFVASIVKYELVDEIGSGWPELIQFLNVTTHSQDAAEREFGLYILSIVTEQNAEDFLKHFLSLVPLFNNALQETGNLCAFHTIQILTNFVPYIGQEQTSQMQALIPLVIQAILVLAQSDEERATEAIEIFDDMVISEVAMIVPYIKQVVEMCLNIAKNTELDSAVRVKALSFLDLFIGMKKKTVLKNRLIEPILEVIFPMLGTPAEDEEEEEFLAEEVNSPLTAAAHSLDVLALNVPAEKIVQPLLKHVQPALESPNIWQQKAAFLCLAVVVEGTSDYIRTKKLLHPFIELICKGITNENPIVRGAALFALGQFAENLQPDISKYASELLPVLFEFLPKSYQPLPNGKDPPGLDRMFYAVETFCENLEDDLMPYLPTLIQHLMDAIDPKYSIHVRELAISGISSAATAVKEAMLPYFGQIMDQLKVYLTTDQPDEMSSLVNQTIETLATFARTIGENNFAPLSEECVNLGLNLVKNKDDPDLRFAVYGLFGSLSTVMKENMAPYLPQITEMMIKTVISEEGIIEHRKEDGEILNGIGFSDDEEAEDADRDENEDDDEEDIASLSVENAYMDEKEAACTALSEMAGNTGVAFLPYMERSMTEVYKLVIHPHDDIRQAAVESLAQFCVAISKAADKTALLTALNVTIPKLSEVIRTETEPAIVTEALDGFASLLKEIGAPVLEGEGHLEAIVTSVQEIMQNKTPCQDDDSVDEDEQEAEQDAALIQYAGDVIPNLGKAMTPQQFAPIFSGLLPHFLAKTKKTCTESERSYSIGALAESVEALSGVLGPFVSELFNVFHNGAQDEDEEIRSNAIYGLGVLAEHGRDDMFLRYENILTLLSSIIIKETNQRTIDNICGALARLIMTNPVLIPLEQVFPVLLEQLPLKEDLEENVTVFKCFLFLYQNGCGILTKFLPKIMRTAAGALLKCKQDKDLGSVIAELLQRLNSDHPQDFKAVLSTLPPKEAELLTRPFWAPPAL